MCRVLLTRSGGGKTPSQLLPRAILCSVVAIIFALFEGWVFLDGASSSVMIEHLRRENAALRRENALLRMGKGLPERETPPPRWSSSCRSSGRRAGCWASQRAPSTCSRSPRSAD